MLVTFQDKVTVPENELHFLAAMLEDRRKMSVRFAVNAIKNGNYGAYINLRDTYRYTDELLSLSMFEGHRYERKEEFPEYVDESEPFFDDATLDYLYSDGSCISEGNSADVPF